MNTCIIILVCGVSASSATPINKIMTSFPGAMRQEHFVTQLGDVLRSEGFGKNSLFASSFCCDEINTPLRRSIESLDLFGDSSFTLGGLAGFPFTGVTGFSAFSHHIPTSGNALIVIGPHVGVDKHGVLGSIHRRGRDAPSSSCGALAAATAPPRAAGRGRMPVAFDTQQDYIQRVVDAIDDEAEPVVFLTKILQNQVNMLIAIIQSAIAIDKNCIPKGSSIAIVGGIYINSDPSFFLPLFFEIRNSDGTVLKNILNRLP